MAKHLHRPKSDAGRPYGQRKQFKIKRKHHLGGFKGKKEAGPHGVTARLKDGANPVLWRRIQFQPAVKVENGFNTGAADLSKAAKARASSDGFVAPRPTGLCSEEMVLRLLRWRTTFSVGPGFANLGNTCYMNSVLQCLLYTPPLSQLFSRELTAKFRDEQTRFGPALVARQFARLVGIVRQGKGSVVAPKGMRSLLSVVGRQFRPHAQEDAHEFTRCLVDTLHQAVLRAHRVRDNTPDAWTSHVFRVFGGFLRSQVRCASCGFTSNKHDPCMDLALELARNVTSIERALKHFTATEKLDADNRWQCDGCKRKVIATKRLTLRHPPLVLTLLLKRFAFGDFLGKISTMVTYPEVLDVRPYVSPEHAHDVPTKYRLFGVLVHSGSSMRFGHYYSYVKTPSGTWCKMDDASVHQTSLAHVLGQRAYMLFYAREPGQAAPAAAHQTPPASTPAPAPAAAATAPPAAA
eukprot:CAMPEP_0196769176 /NCGR_PEP_ID=MMETSP1104-20130614/380_1 /TAXON_ID=33652 /ORGANISM="Cafeteria sp., Strain Caron Lab Isolate" /LENGTH=463 /DNA_ID=CAMNT_0042139261 /DNA_START=145 /DNA_END=1532 /DNA_ORIENTATION=+